MPTGLSHQRILAVALEIAEREGLEALSMRRLAQELDVWPMSVYRYFADKDALLDAMAAASAGEVTRPSGRGPWRDQVRALLVEAERSIAGAPGLATRLPRAFLTPSGLKLWEAGMTILADGGFAPGDGAAAWRALWSYTYGFATFRVDSARSVRVAVAGLPEDDYPSLVDATSELAAALTSDEEFERGLDALLDGLEQRLAALALD